MALLAGGTVSVSGWKGKVCKRQGRSSLRVLQRSWFCREQWFSTSLTLPPFKTVPSGAVTPNRRIILLVLQQYEYAAVISHSVFDM